MRKAVVTAVKIIAILVIPYFMVTGLMSNVWQGYMTGIWWHWPDQSIAPETLPPNWYVTQLVITIALISPLIVYSYIFQDRLIDKTSVFSAACAVGISFSGLVLLNPDLLSYGFIRTPFYQAQYAVSLSVFVFVFWTLFQNARASTSLTKDKRKASSFLARMKEVLRDLIPINSATAIWIALILLPTNLHSSTSLSESGIQHFSLTLSSYPLLVQYRYDLVVYGISPDTDILYSILDISWLGISFPLILYWSFNVWLGVSVLRLFQGHSSRKLVAILATVSILVSSIPDILLLSSLLSLGGLAGYSAIPLPLYQILCLLIARRAKVPDEVLELVEEPSEDSIDVPLTVRVLSWFRKTRNKDSQH